MGGIIMYNSTKILASGQQMKRLYEKQFEDICQRYQLTQNEIDILVFLANNPSFDTASDIVEVRMIAKSYISKSVESLIKKGLLVRIPDKEDRRIIHLHLTEYADSIITEGRLRQKEFVKLLFTGMDDNEIKTLEFLLGKIFENVEKVSDK